MRASSRAVACDRPRLFARQRGAAVALALLACVLSGCASPALDTSVINDLPPLRLDDTTLTAADAASRVPPVDLLSLDQPMREFVARHTGGQQNTRLRLFSLHEAVRGAGGLDMQYDPYAEGTAREVFHRGVANCLSYANLFIALAREAGLEANYQWLQVRPQWSRVSERVQLGLHVNVIVRLRDGKEYMVDIDPPPTDSIGGSQTLSDDDGKALYYNNVAMAALGNDDRETAWLYLVRALQLNPENAHLWTNLGAIYRSNGQHQEAEQSYLQALDLDFSHYTAMTNLAVLYSLEGRAEERDYWLGRIEGHRKVNPYYHAWQGDEAAAEGDWIAALAHYDQAVSLSPRDSHLLFSRGLIYYQLEDYEAATRDIERAIKLATLHTNVAYYQRQLDRVRKARSAGV